MNQSIFPPQCITTLEPPGWPPTTLVITVLHKSAGTCEFTWNLSRKFSCTGSSLETYNYISVQMFSYTKVQYSVYLILIKRLRPSLDLRSRFMSKFPPVTCKATEVFVCSLEESTYCSFWFLCGCYKNKTHTNTHFRPSPGHLGQS